MGSIAISKCCGAQDTVRELPTPKKVQQKMRSVKGPINHSDKNNSYSIGIGKSKISNVGPLLNITDETP